jgi:transcriptional regulator
MSAKKASLMLKVFVLYVHREYSTYEIAIMLGMSAANIGIILKKIEKTSRTLAVVIRKQKKLNFINAQSKMQEQKLGRN